ncbi:protein translocase subunit SecD [Candidatus Hydrogenosomobacter endosymbioticus]|uniref:Protein translocase subunit SecD n=1 Tax=Candidatus Hydrogenosomobacter endosymbioticus TaxID=2558174 RepID=A0ABN6L334_9PROT|nr:protein translocase subunit SecD [Candidatus Hydrogenosomobacter endosymbioticus]BDB96129.1 protein translocase subunit SecD [Candidatus Hydrogenosomobacter endosymbioticus]
MPHWLPSKSLVLGLDLQGGVHLLLEVGTKELMAERYAGVAKSIKDALRKEKIRYSRVKSDSSGVSLAIVSDIGAGAAAQVLQKSLRNFSGQLDIKPSGSGMHIKFNTSTAQQMVSQAVEQSIEVVRKRVDVAGTAEILIQKQGEDMIVLQIPGFDDPQRVRSLLGKTAKLTFRWVEGIAKKEDSGQSTDSASVLAPYKQDGESYYMVKKETLLTGEDLLRAFPSQDERGLPAIGIEFTSQGGRVFAEVTDPSINKGKMFAIVLDEKVLMAPRISVHIQDGKGIITGGQYGFSVQEANDLSLLMRSGALPAPLKVVEEKVVGPGLGRDSIYLGGVATLIAIAAVCVFMLCAYSFFGIFAVIGVFFNLCFLMAALIYIGATLTLPGIAGIALTIGMAVDSNVLINERIKEEVRSGRRLISAIDSGHRKAMNTIIDSNATTLVGAFILYLLGTGTVQGFAVTLALGIITSMFTSIELTKFFIVLWLQRFNPKKLWI